jgi:hypothetical protein
VRGRQLADRPEGQRWEAVPFHARLGRKAAEHASQWVCRLQLVVAKRGQHERSRPLDAAAEQAKDVERRLVGPVQVFQHQHARPSPELVDQDPEHLVRPGVVPDQVGERAAGLGSDVGEGRERPRSEERVARAFEDTSSPGRVGAEAPDERGLPDTRLAGDQHQPAVAAFDLLEGVSQGLEERLPLEERACRCRPHG